MQSVFIVVFTYPHLHLQNHPHYSYTQFQLHQWKTLMACDGSMIILTNYTSKEEENNVASKQKKKTRGKRILYLVCLTANSPLYTLLEIPPLYWVACDVLMIKIVQG